MSGTDTKKRSSHGGPTFSSTREAGPISYATIPYSMPELGSCVCRGPVEIKVTLVSGDARVPVQGSRDAAGFDLYSAEDIVIPADKRKLVDLGIKIAIPPGYRGQIAPRSSLALNYSVDVGAGVIDADYRGVVKVLLINHHSTDHYKVKRGDRIAQLLIVACPSVKFVESQALTETTRGCGGFGSTGM